MDFKLTNYALFQFGKDVGAKTPLEAISKMNVISQGYSFEGQEILARLIQHGSKVSYEEAFDYVLDTDFLTDKVIPAINDYVKPFVEVAEKIEKKKVAKAEV